MQGTASATRVSYLTPEERSSTKKQCIALALALILTLGLFAAGIYLMTNVDPKSMSALGAAFCISGGFTCSGGLAAALIGKLLYLRDHEEVKPPTTNVPPPINAGKK